MSRFLLCKRDALRGHGHKAAQGFGADAVRIRRQSASLTAERVANGLENQGAADQAEARLAEIDAFLCAE